MKRRGEQGFTLVELMVVVLVSGILILTVTEMLSQAIRYFHVSSVRQQLESESRDCLSTIIHFLQQGKANSTIISTPAGSPPYSRIDFVLASDTTTAYAFYYSLGTAQMQVTTPAQTSAPQTLAQDVTSLMFMGDSLDPATVLVTLRLDRGVGNQQQTVLLPNQVVHLVTKQ
jgi:prepilin-type N-terminal cleavage/methylation domain-containing protein